MISRIIEFSARNRLLVLLGRGALGVVAVYVLQEIRLDALPDLSDTQVIVYSRWDRSPDIIEDQVTYPITSALLGAPEVKAMRGYSDFGFSYVYVIFEDGTDLYWARSRVLEYLSKIQARLPEGVKTELGPDATGVGWVFQYALVDRTGTHSPDELRSLPGLDAALRAAGGARRGRGRVDRRVRAAVPDHRRSDQARRLRPAARPGRRAPSAPSNNEVGGRLMEFSGSEYMVRGRGYSRIDRRLRADRRQGRAGRHARAAARRRARRDRAGDPPRRRRSRRPRRHGRRHRGHAARRERPERDPAG